MPNTPPNLIAGEEIYARRFIQLDTAEEHQGLLAAANGAIIGISGDPTKWPPLSDLVTADPPVAAEDGDSFQMKGAGEICLLEAGATITAGQRLKSTATGTGEPVATTGTTRQEYGARSLQAGASGDYILVQVELGLFLPAEA